MKCFLTFIMAILIATTAPAATCADRNTVVERLEEHFNEFPIANTISVTENILEVYANHETEAWTVLLTIPEKRITCLASSGHTAVELQEFLKTLATPSDA